MTDKVIDEEIGEIDSTNGAIIYRCVICNTLNDTLDNCCNQTKFKIVKETF
jgi:hypothetical protein